jgi:Asp-tRNA(Asn)/Glu-tRNA(Gln) amidotransferase A subunit family amidase
MIPSLVMKRSLGWMVFPILLFALGSCQQQEEPQEAFQLLEATVPEIQAALVSGTITAQDLVEMYLARIAAYDQQGPSLNAIITVNPNALAEAKELDAERAANGPRGPLHGIPVIVKDNYETQDMETTAGSLSLAGWVPPHDAFLVKRLREGGAIILAKATLHEFAMGITTVGSFFGQTRNPYALDRNPGGSSGGTGAAVAANFAAAGLGTDTCSSIRTPSAHNNLVGLRGTQGLASRRGIVPLSHTQDIGGPMGRSVTDVAIVLGAIVGYDPEDPQTAESVGNIPESYTAFLREEGLGGSRIGLLPALFSTVPDDEGVAQVVRRAMSEMEQQGAEVVEVTIPGFDELLADPLLLAEYETRDDMNAYLAQHPGAPVRSFKEILDSGKYHPAIESRLRRRQEIPPPDTREYLEQLVKRTTLRRAVLLVMAEHDLDAIAYATISRVAAPIGENQEGSNGCFSANSGLPAITVPAGFTDQGLPVGLELLGRAWSEGRLIELAYAYEQATQHRRSPASTPAVSSAR